MKDLVYKLSVVCCWAMYSIDTLTTTTLIWMAPFRKDAVAAFRKYRCQNLGTLVTWQLAATGRQGPAGHPTLHLLLHKHCHNIVCTTSGTGLWGSTRPARRPQVIHKLCKLSTNYPQIIYPLHDFFHHLSHQVGQDELVNVHCSWQSPLCSQSQNSCCCWSILKQNEKCLVW